MWRIRDWGTHFENNRSRELKKLDWVPFPNKQDGDGYTELLDHPNGAAHFGVWCALVQVASKCGIRGTLVRDGGRPHDSTTLSRVTRIPKVVIDEAVDRLVHVIGWIENVVDAEGLTEISHHDAGKSHEHAALPQADAVLSFPSNTPSIPSSLNGESEGKPKRVRAEYPPDFEAWWLLYPQKANKADAARAFSKAVARIKLRDGATDPLEFLADAAREFAKSPTGTGRYCPHPATWLNDAKYDDDRKLWQRGDDDGRRSTGTAGRVGPGQRYTGPDA